jgi:hypothetical protein
MGCSQRTSGTFTSSHFLTSLHPTHHYFKAIKRAHRIGQTRDVFVEKIIISGSVEEKMLELNEDLSLMKHSGID